MIDYKEKAREFLEMQGWTRGIVDGMTPLVALLESTAKDAEAEAVEKCCEIICEERNPTFTIREHFKEKGYFSLDPPCNCGQYGAIRPRPRDSNCPVHGGQQAALKEEM